MPLLNKIEPCADFSSQRLRRCANKVTCIFSGNFLKHRDVSRKNGGTVLRGLNYWQTKTLALGRHEQTVHTVSTQVLAIAPLSPSKYTLILTLVQEMVGWFEDMGGGFEPAIAMIAVGMPEGQD